MVWSVIEVLALLAIAGGLFIVAGIDGLGPALIVAGALAIAASWFVNRRGGDSS